MGLGALAGVGRGAGGGVQVFDLLTSSCVTLAIYLISPSLSFFICEKNPVEFYWIYCRIF